MPRNAPANLNLVPTKSLSVHVDGKKTLQKTSINLFKENYSKIICSLSRVKTGVNLRTLTKVKSLVENKLNTYSEGLLMSEHFFELGSN